jgi:hypothetical protein
VGASSLTALRTPSSLWTPSRNATSAPSSIAAFNLAIASSRPKLKIKRASAKKGKEENKGGKFVPLGSVCACNDDKVASARNGIASLRSGADPSAEVGDVDELFAEKMAAALCLDLVLDVQPCDAGFLVLGDCPGDLCGTTEALRRKWD